MRTITLRRISLSKFKSFLTSVTIDFDPQAGMILVAGDNRVEPKLGANGSGKSTILDALCFCLYGVSVRSVRVGDLVTSGSKKTEVVCTLDIDGIEYEIARSGPPSRVFVAGEGQVAQDFIEKLVGLTRRQFLNSVVFGQAMPLFIDLPIPERGDLLDEVLDLQLWMRAAHRASERHGELTESLIKLKVDLARAEGSLAALEDTSALESMASEWEVSREARLAGEREIGAASSADLESLQSQLREVESQQLRDPSALMKRLESYSRVEGEIRSNLAVRKSDIKRIEEDLEFFRSTAQCPSCGQEIEASFAEEHLSRHESELKESTAVRDKLEAELVTASTRVSRSQVAWDEASRRRTERERTVARLEAEVRSKSREVETASSRVESIRSEENPHSARVAQVAEQRSSLQGVVTKMRRRATLQSSRLAELTFWQQGFRRMRLFCINRVLRQLDVETMNEAQALGLAGWQVRYSTETETKSGTTKLGVQIQVQAPHMSGQFSSWSGGEGQRIRLATALGFGSLIQRNCGVRWRFEAFDEPTAFLSEAGIEDLLDLLRDRAQLRDRVICVADHRGLQHAGFDRILSVTKGPEGSYLSS